MFDQEPLHNFRKSPDLTQVLEFDSSEQIIIPSSAPYVVRLKEVPDCEIENQRPMITGFIEVYDQTYGFVSPDQSNQFQINYNTGDVIFNELNADQTIFISYYKKGTYFEGKYINDIVNVLSDITETLIDHTHDLSFIDADELNGHDGTYYLDYSNFINVPDLTGNLSASELLSMILGVDGTDSELDADLFDGRESSEFADSTHNHDNSYSDLDHSHNDLYSILGHSHPGSDITGFVSDSTNADLLDGYDGTYYLDYNNFINTPDTSVVVAQHDALSGINESDSTQFHLNKNQFNQLTDLTDTTIHNHDSFYYTKSQIDISLSGKSDLTHDHDLEYSETDHSHSDLYSDLTHFHVGSDITSAVANANDADTLDGTHSSGFAASGHNHDSSYSGLIHYHSGGDITTSVSDSTNSDKLDGQHGSYYLDATHLNAGILPSARFDDTAHGSRAGGSLHSAVTASVNGFMLAADKTKLDAIESGATADMSASEILTAIKTVDGTASGLDADLLDNQHGSYYSDITARLGYTPVNKSGDTMSGVLVIPVGSVSAPSLTFVGDTSTGLYRITTNEIGITTGGTLAVDIDSLGDTNIYGRLRSSGNKSRPSWNTTGCAFDSAAATFTDTDGTGVISTIRCANTFNKPTFSSSNDVTINNAATVYINDAPVAGTNTTIINRWALRISAGDVYIGAGIYFGGSVSSSSWTTLSPKFHMPSISLTDTDGTGTISSRMAFSFYRPTFASSNSVTITNAATLYIGNPPLAGANTTITNAYSLQIQGGNSQFGGDVTASNFIGGGSGLSSVNALAVSGYPIWKSGDNQTCIPIISLSGNTPVGYTIDFYNEDATESYTNRITSNSGYLALSGHLTCGDTTLCTNLNADLLDGTHSSGFAASGHKHDSDYLSLSGGTLTGALILPNGSYSAPALKGTVDADTGFYFPVAGAISISNNGAQSVRFYNNAIGIGTGNPTVTTALHIHKDYTGGATSYGIYQGGEVQSDVTSVFYANYTSIKQAADFTLVNLRHYVATQGTILGTITNQIAFHASDNLIGATNNYGFYGGIPSGSGYNLYMAGTAPNYLTGITGIGVLPESGYYLKVAGASLFNGGVYLNYASPTVVFNETDQDVNLKRWSLFAYNQKIYLQAQTDDATALSNTISIDRTGLLTVASHLMCVTTTLCTNLNADLLDGTHSSGFAASGHNHDSDYLKLTGGTLSGALNVQGRLQSSGNQSMAAWGTAGIAVYSAAATFTNTSSTGTVANTVANSFLKPTFASSNSVTITSAATVYIADAPDAGTNTTITNAQALKVNAGNCYFGGDVQASTFTGNGAALTNVNAATLDSLDSLDFVKIATAQTITAAHTFTSAGGIAFNLGSTINYLTRKTTTDELLYISGGTSIADGGTIGLYGGTHGTYPGMILFRCGGAKDIGSIRFQSHDGTVSAGIMYIDQNGNVIIGPNVAGPASGTRSLGIRSGTAPSTMTDMAQIYAADIVAGKCAIHCQAENGDLIKLYTTTALTAQLTTITHTAPAAEDFAISAPINTNAYGFANANEFNTCMKVIANLQTRLSQVETRLQDLGLLG